MNSRRRDPGRAREHRRDPVILTHRHTGIPVSRALDRYAGMPPTATGAGPTSPSRAVPSRARQ
ncbi:MAG TPA: hypothetical protein PKC73_09660 [Dermatophilaceae bacterium]|nr:hypothetical protein [Actinomycetales bacterium]HMT32898.1 hypothetical protein [Dermatophilaceae bacterium]HMT89892.1 hypothetical protein [Dermatophilaceae bacterium]